MQHQNEKPQSGHVPDGITHHPSSHGEHSNDSKDKPDSSGHGHTGHTSTGGGHTTPPPTPGGHKPPVPAPKPHPVPTPTPSPTPVPVPASGTIPIFNFGTNGASLATNPNLAGTYLGYPWSLLEPSQGQFAWDIIDKDMQPWLATGKDIIIRVSASGWASWGAHPNKSWTPSWVYGLGVKSVTESDGAIKPQYWNPAFLQALSDFVTAFAAKYDGNPNIISIEAGIGDGGETKPDTRKSLTLSAWQNIGYSDPVWFDTIKHIVDLYKSAFQHTPIAIMPDNSFLGKTAGLDEHAVVNYAVSKGCWLQHNGIVAGIKRDPTWTTPIIAEQRNKLANSGDTMAQDIQVAIDFGASYFMGFEVDLQANLAVLAKYAASVQH